MGGLHKQSFLSTHWVFQWRSFFRVPCFSFPYPQISQVTPGCRRCWGGGRQTVRTAVFTSAHLPRLAFSLTRASWQLPRKSLFYSTTYSQVYSKKGKALPMSLLKLPSLLSKPSWTTISSTLNVCSVDESLSFRAFFPRTTEKRRLFWWDLKYKFKRPSDWLTQHLSKASVLIPTYRESSGQLSGPNMPRSDSRHSEKRSPCSCFARRWQPPMGVIPLWQWFRQQSSFASSWCDGHRWSPQLWGKNKLNVAQKAKAWNVSGDDATWPWISWRGRR